MLMNNIKLGILTFVILLVSICVFINRGRPRWLCAKLGLAQSYIHIFVETTNINNTTANLGTAEK